MRRLPSVLVLFVFVPALAAASELDNLAKDLKSRNPETRARAAESLGELKSGAAVDLLVQTLSDREAKVRAAAASALWNASDVAQSAIPALRNAVNDADPYVVVCAAGALIAMDVPAKELAVPLRGVLQKGDPYDRFHAASLLTGVEPAGNLVEPIVDYLRRNLPDERLDVSSYMEREKSLDLAKKALMKLGETQDRTQIEPLMTHLRSAPASIIPPILLGLGQLKPPPDRWVETLIGQLSAHEPSVRKTAIELLGKQKAAVDIRKWAPAVARLTKDSDENVRGWAISTLAEGKGLAHEAFSSVLQMVSSERDDHLRARAADVAGDIGNAEYPIDSAIKAAMGKEALPILANAIEKDTDRHVRENALKSLNSLQIDPSEVVPILARAAVEGKESGFRTDALIMLSNLGPDAAQAKAMIEPLTRDPDPEVARIAKNTLKSISKLVISPQKAAKSTPAPSDPAARERGFALLREKNVQFDDNGFIGALNNLDRDLITAFLDAGMSPSRFRDGGDLPVQFLFRANDCGAGVKPLVKLLIDRGADANGADENGNTVLMKAAERCDGEMIKMLIKAGAKVQAKNATGRTALEDAIFGVNAASAATALVAAGARLTPEQAKSYRETYKKQPKVLELITMATK